MLLLKQEVAQLAVVRLDEVGQHSVGLELHRDAVEVYVHAVEVGHKIRSVSLRLKRSKKTMGPLLSDLPMPHVLQRVFSFFGSVSCEASVAAVRGDLSPKALYTAVNPLQYVEGVRVGQEGGACGDRAPVLVVD